MILEDWQGGKSDSAGVDVPQRNGGMNMVTCL